MVTSANKTVSSDLDVVNIALAHLGSDTISSFEENNKRARLSNALYYPAFKHVLSLGEWTFARNIRTLQEVADPEFKAYTFVYQVPADCVTPIDVLPFTARTKWEVINSQIHTNITPANLVYITSEFGPSKFTPGFVQALSIYLSGLLAYPITQDEELGRGILGDEFPVVLSMALSTDANIGSQHMHLDRNPRRDTFVEPEGTILDDEQLDFAKRYLLPT